MKHCHSEMLVDGYKDCMSKLRERMRWMVRFNLSLADGMGFSIEQPDLADISRGVKRVMTKLYSLGSEKYELSILLDNMEAPVECKLYRLEYQYDGSALPIRMGKFPKELAMLFDMDADKIAHPPSSTREIVRRYTSHPSKFVV